MGPEDRGAGGDYPAPGGVCPRPEHHRAPRAGGQEGRAGVTQDGGPACGKWTDRQHGLPCLPGGGGSTLTVWGHMGPEAVLPDPSFQGRVRSCENHRAPHRPTMVHGRGMTGHGAPTDSQLGAEAAARPRHGHLSTSTRAGALRGDPGATAARPACCSLSVAPSTLGGPGSRRPGRGRRLAAAITTTMNDPLVRPPRSREPCVQQVRGQHGPGLCGGPPGAWRGWGSWGGFG